MFWLLVLVVWCSIFDVMFVCCLFVNCPLFVVCCVGCCLLLNRWRLFRAVCRVCVFVNGLLFADCCSLFDVWCLMCVVWCLMFGTVVCRLLSLVCCYCCSLVVACCCMWLCAVCCCFGVCCVLCVDLQFVRNVVLFLVLFVVCVLAAM